MQPVWVQPGQPVWVQPMVAGGGAPMMMGGGGMPMMGGMPGGMPMMGAAAQPAPESWLTVAQRGQWAKLDGAVAVASVGSDSSVWGTTSSQDVYRRQHSGAPWQHVPGVKLVQVNAANFNRAVGVSASQQIFEFNGECSGARARARARGRGYERDAARTFRPRHSAR